MSLPRSGVSKRGRRRMAAGLALGAVALSAVAPSGPGTVAGPSTAAAASAVVTTVIDPEGAKDVATVPAVTPIPIRNDFDDLAVRPDGTMVVATSANTTYTKSKPAQPAATVARYSALGVQLPSLSLVAPGAGAYTTHTAVTPAGAVVAWATKTKVPVLWMSEMSDDGIATAPRQLSTPGLSGWPEQVASGGGAVGVLFSEAKPGRHSRVTLKLAYRAPGATTFRTAAVPTSTRGSRVYYSYRLVIGASGDAAIAAWSNDPEAASLWRIGRDGTVGPEIHVPIKRKEYVDVMLAVGGDGTIGATFGQMDDRAPDHVLIAQVPPGSNALGPLVRLKPSDGGSLSTQGIGLAVSPAGRLLVSVEDTGGSQLIIEGSGTAFTKTYVPYLHDGSSLATWMPDGSAVVVLEADDDSAYPTQRRLFSIRHAPGAAFGAPRQIGPEVTGVPADWGTPRPATEKASGTQTFSFVSLVPAADGSAALAWEAYDGHRDNLSVARIVP